MNRRKQSVHDFGKKIHKFYAIKNKPWHERKKYKKWPLRNILISAGFSFVLFTLGSKSNIYIPLKPNVELRGIA